MNWESRKEFTRGELICPNVGEIQSIRLNNEDYYSSEFAVRTAEGEFFANGRVSSPHYRGSFGFIGPDYDHMKTFLTDDPRILMVVDHFRLTGDSKEGDEIPVPTMEEALEYAKKHNFPKAYPA